MWISLTRLTLPARLLHSHRSSELTCPQLPSPEWSLSDSLVQVGPGPKANTYLPHRLRSGCLAAANDIIYPDNTVQTPSVHHVYPGNQLTT